MNDVKTNKVQAGVLKSSDRLQELEVKKIYSQGSYNPVFTNQKLNGVGRETSTLHGTFKGF